MNQQAEATIAAIGSKATQAGGATVLFGWLTVNDFVLIAGLIVTVAGFAVNLYFKRKDDSRRGEEHSARMTLLSRGVDPDGD